MLAVLLVGSAGGIRAGVWQTEWISHNGHEYRMAAFAISWQGARDLAHSVGGYLVIVDDAAENEWLAGTFTAPHGPAFIGLMQVSLFDTFEEEPGYGWGWDLGPPLEGFKRWGQSEPDAVGDVAIMQTNGEWIDGSRSEVSAAIIERQPAPLPTRFEWRSADGGNGHEYEVVNIPGGLTWEEAIEGAVAHNGHLATITSFEEWHFVVRVALNHWPRATQSVWLGGAQEPGASGPTIGWRWITGEPFAFDFWCETFPLSDPSRNRVALHPAGCLRNWNPGDDPWGYVVEYGTEHYCPGDVTGDQLVGLDDLAGMLAAFGAHVGDPEWNPAADLDFSATVDLSDLAGLLGAFGDNCP